MQGSLGAPRDCGGERIGIGGGGDGPAELPDRAVYGLDAVGRLRRGPKRAQRAASAQEPSRLRTDGEAFTGV